ncbi:alpha/beta fold hydrolase [Stenotrophomonas maltophilia]|uniref:alpha/beta fold hydrolase n=1 Tax=Stenotrophomonas maltophilia TaxID=40324 RepID=UPI003896E1AB
MPAAGRQARNACRVHEVAGQRPALPLRRHRHHFLKGFQAALPQAQVYAFEDAGHYVLEDKQDVLVPEIRAFLDSNPI